MKNNHPKLPMAICLVFAVGFLAFAYKAVSYAFLESFIPLILFFLYTALFMFSFYRGEKQFHKALKFWAITLVIWSVLRLILMVLIKLQLNEPHLLSQVNAIDIFKTLSILGIGIYLNKQLVTIKKAA